MNATADNFKKCDICRAGYRRPLTDGWVRVEYRVGTRTYLQLHKPTCPAGWKPVPDPRAAAQ